jgi:hypothetical protein
MRDYFIHAGCVGRRGRALIIAGRSGLGKSTLTSFLVARGMTYLSDEIAPLGRNDGRVAPFPLRLGIRPGPAADLVRAAPGEEARVIGGRKKMVDAGDWGVSVERQALPLHAAIFLSRSAGAQVATARKFTGDVRIYVWNLQPEFETELLARTGAQLVERRADSAAMTSLVLRGARPETFLAELQGLAAARQAQIAGIEYEDLQTPDYQAHPRLVSLPPAAGVMELAKRIFPGQKRLILQMEFDNRLPRLIQDLLQAVRGAAFYRLIPGRLDEMVALVEDLP